jgi:FkbM family methyltransferase
MSTKHQILSELFNPSSQYDSPYCVDKLLRNKKIILYGAGDGFITFSLFVLSKYGLAPSVLLDRKFGLDEAYFGIPAFSPLEYKPTNHDQENAVVVVTVGKSEYHQEILAALKGLGFHKIILSTDIYEYHLLHPTAELEKKGFNYYLDNRDKMMTCLDLFSDDLSKDIFTGFIATHIKKMPIRIPCNALSEQYFPKDIDLSKGYSRFINCGAYDGDTVRQLNTLHGKVDIVACFEPDMDNFDVLRRDMSARKDQLANNIILFPCGVFSHETQLRFSSGHRINSMISKQGDSFIQCVALDHVIPGFEPTYITMDVEGVELEALRGAERLIRDSIPDLAICVYHSPNHIWDIPLYINSLNLGYKFYLRNYTSFPSETVLYASI